MSWKVKNSKFPKIKECKSIEDFPEGCIGFIYMIMDANGKMYIGQKSLYSMRKKNFGKRKIAEITDKRKKTYEIIKSESNWLTYTGSNKNLNENIKNGLGIQKLILHFCFTKKQLSYYEVKEMMIHGVLEDPVNYYNDNILGKFYSKDV